MSAKTITVSKLALEVAAEASWAVAKVGTPAPRTAVHGVARRGRARLRVALLPPTRFMPEIVRTEDVTSIASRGSDRAHRSQVLSGSVEIRAILVESKGSRVLRLHHRTRSTREPPTAERCRSYFSVDRSFKRRNRDM